MAAFSSRRLAENARATVSRAVSSAGLSSALFEGPAGILGSIGASAAGAFMGAQSPYDSLTVSPEDAYIGDASEAGRDDYVVRRPTLGVTHRAMSIARLDVLRVTGDTPRSLLFNSSAPGGQSETTTNCMILDISQSASEPVSVEITNTGYRIRHTGGNVPNQLAVSGVLFDAPNFPWLSEFLANWSNTLRGSKTVLDDSLVCLHLYGRTYKGTLMSMSVQQQAATSQVLVPFNLSLILEEVVLAEAVEQWPQNPDMSPIDALYRQMLGGDSADDATANPAEAIIAEGAVAAQSQRIIGYELVRGTYAGQKPRNQEVLLNDALNQLPVYEELDVNALVAAAFSANQAAGQSIFDLQAIRAGAIQNRLDLMASTGVMDPVQSLLPFGANSAENAVFAEAMSPLARYNTGFVGDGISVSGEGQGSTSWTAR